MVSIIIPYYNNEDVFEETLESLQKQEYKNLEIIIIDDCSNKNDCFNIIKRFNSLNIIYRRNAKNFGASKSRNIGLKIAQGDYIQFLDADDIISPNKISKQLDILKIKVNAIAIGDWKYFINKNEMALNSNQNKHLNKDYSVEEFLYELNNYFDRMMPIHSYLIPRAIINKTHGWDESISLGDDGEYMNRIIASSDKVIYTPQIISYYRRGNFNSLSHKRDKEGTLSSLKCVESYEKVVQKHFPGNKRLVDSIVFRYSLLYQSTFKDAQLRKLIKERIKLEYNSRVLPIGSFKSKLIQRLLGIDFYLKFKHKITKSIFY